ncbi:hypothetical protein QCA50_008155 [Cerrena zonata]|uniref:Secreted protein n=1 Tax=Cerrena zonata TaxID=2478898 RepID=A0AAW0GF96_9APHY
MDLLMMLLRYIIIYILPKLLLLPYSSRSQSNIVSEPYLNYDCSNIHSSHQTSGVEYRAISNWFRLSAQPSRRHYTACPLLRKHSRPPDAHPRTVSLIREMRNTILTTILITRTYIR